DDLHGFCALDEADRYLLGLRRIEFWRLAEDAEHGDALAAHFGIKIGQPVDRFLVNAAVVVERRRRDRKGACGPGGKFCHFCLLSLRHSGARPWARTRNPCAWSWLWIPGSTLRVAPE